MKFLYRAALLICLLAFMQPAAAMAQTYDGNQVILSWTLDNAHTQTVTWHSKSRKEGYVQYNREGMQLSGEHQVKARSTEIKSGYFRYEAVIKGLSQKTTYDYRIGDGSSWSKARTFTTAPAAASEGVTASDHPQSFEFLYLGDVQYQDRSKDFQIWGTMIQDIRQRNPGIAFALLGGDMVNSPQNMTDWNLFLNQASPVFSYIPMMTAIGNHETTIKAEPYLKMLSLPKNGPDGVKEEFYSFDYGNCHFTVLNTSFFLDNRKAVLKEGWQGKLDEINAWLAEDLTESSAKWKILLMHHPAYGISDGDPLYDEIRENWEPLFEQGKADLVLCGHQHLYMRTKEIGGITYVMGNSGKRRSTYYNGENFPDYGKALDATNSNYQIIKVSDEMLSLESYDEEGQIIDKWTKDSDPFLLVKAAITGAVIISVALIAVLIRGLRLRRKKR